MKVLFSISGKPEGKKTKIDPRFGRAEAFLLYNDEDNSFTLIENTQNVNAPAGAGIQAAQTATGTGCEILVTGSVGPKAFKVLNTSSVKIACGMSNLTIEEALCKIEQNKIEYTDSPTTVGLG